MTVTDKLTSKGDSKHDEILYVENCNVPCSIFSYTNKIKCKVT